MKKTAENGLTMIELLLVIGMMTVLAGITVGLVDVNRNQEIAEEGVSRANLVKAAAGIEGFFSAEGYYPASTSAAGVSSYISNWPGADYIYFYDATLQEFSVSIVVTSNVNKMLKYSSVWKEIRDCDDSTTINDVNACQAIDTN